MKTLIRNSVSISTQGFINSTGSAYYNNADYQSSLPQLRRLSSPENPHYGS